MRKPDAFEFRDVIAIDFTERRVTTIVEIAAVRGPARDRQLRQRVRGAIA
jgi:hypothetical protein